MKRLNMWQRLGIVLSVLWVLGAGAYQWRKTARAGSEYALASVHLCERLAKPGAPANCWDEWMPSYKLITEYVWWEMAARAFIPLILAWLFAYLTLWTVRWVLAGRRVTVDQQEAL